MSAAEKIYSEAMGLLPEERRSLALRLLTADDGDDHARLAATIARMREHALASNASEWSEDEIIEFVARARRERAER